MPASTMVNQAQNPSCAMQIQLPQCQGAAEAEKVGDSIGHGLGT